MASKTPVFLYNNIQNSQKPSDESQTFLQACITLSRTHTHFEAVAAAVAREEPSLKVSELAIAQKHVLPTSVYTLYIYTYTQQSSSIYCKAFIFKMRCVSRTFP